MAVKAVWAVWHSCGHEEEHDLSARRAFRRASYARWLAGRDCGDCRWARRNTRATEERARDQAKFQPDELVEITEWASPNSTPVFPCSKAAVDWAHRVWLLFHGARCSERARTSAAEPAQVAEAAARRLRQACWWAAHPKAEAADVGEGLADRAIVPVRSGKEAR
jgi:hypothetical protein